MAIKQLCDDDCSLLERIQRGDDVAMALLYDRHSSVVYSVAFRVLRNPALAEQVLSDIFLDIWRSSERLMEITGSLSPLLAMNARNRAIAVLLHKAPSDLDFAPPYVRANHQDLDMTREEACTALNQLPMDRRIMLERVLFPESTQSDLAGLTKRQIEADKDLVNDGTVSQLDSTGLEVIDLQSDVAFARRHLHIRDAVSHVEGMNRLARVFVESPNKILQELVTAAVDLCGADSAGISIEQKDASDENFWHWVATAGQYSGFMGARLPRYPSACGVTLERGRPQIFHVTKRFFDLMGVQAPTVTDGMLFPWQTGETRGTIWIMAHGRTEAFDQEDCRLMQALANFAATGVRLQQQQKLLLDQARIAATSAIANDLAHQINNPLQGLMQTVFLFGRGGADSGVFAQQAMGDIARLSDIVKRLLTFHG